MPLFLKWICPIRLKWSNFVHEYLGLNGFSSQGGFDLCIRGLCGLVAMIASSVSLSIPWVGDSGDVDCGLGKSSLLGTRRSVLMESETFDVSLVENHWDFLEMHKWLIYTGTFFHGSLSNETMMLSTYCILHIKNIELMVVTYRK